MTCVRLFLSQATTSGLPRQSWVIGESDGCLLWRGLPSILASHRSGISPEATRVESTFPGSTHRPNFMPAARTVLENSFIPRGNFSRLSWYVPSPWDQSLVPGTSELPSYQLAS